LHNLIKRVIERVLIVDKQTNLEYFQNYLANGTGTLNDSRFTFPAPIGKTIGFELVEIGHGTASIELNTNPEIHGNPMGTVHGGVLCDIADAAIGCAHVTTLAEGESFTSVDLQINFFRPVWKETLKATARPVNSGKTISRYVCDIVKADGKLAAQVTSTVMTLRNESAAGR
jgi:uncharacterized protein (TIGR00369 family)